MKSTEAYGNTIPLFQNSELNYWFTWMPVVVTLVVLVLVFSSIPTTTTITKYHWHRCVLMAKDC